MSYCSIFNENVAVNQYYANVNSLGAVILLKTSCSEPCWRTIKQKYWRSPMLQSIIDEDNWTSKIRLLLWEVGHVRKKVERFTIASHDSRCTECLLQYPGSRAQLSFNLKNWGISRFALWLQQCRKDDICSKHSLYKQGRGNHARWFHVHKLETGKSRTAMTVYTVNVTNSWDCICSKQPWKCQDLSAQHKGDLAEWIYSFFIETGISRAGEIVLWCHKKQENVGVWTQKEPYFGWQYSPAWWRAWTGLEFWASVHQPLAPWCP